MSIFRHLTNRRRMDFVTLTLFPSTLKVGFITVHFHIHIVESAVFVQTLTGTVIAVPSKHSIDRRST
ncbi:hypothetical protein COMA2_50238 [Candidatus Nitrospira nitrificans]|uniref:Uncharacterized protein n=1 Tax=Candidatus Nitrospira nitrificans TaxID=1742973 RepID=A0A0S4LMK1_9BACT|nr:hypothetical protein COMA2_50238 [Candidatus Nitrospira nitrificans]